MNREHSNPDELVSALVDGELDGHESAQAIAWLQERADAQANWHAYHLVGDLMRAGGAAAVGANDPAFLTKLRQRLEGEPQIRWLEGFVELAPAASRRNAAGDNRDTDRSANDAGTRWKLAAGFASLSAIAVAAWLLGAGGREPAGAPQLARVDAPVSAQQEQVMIRDPRLDQLLAAHRQSAGVSALQMPAGFLRDATYAVPVR